MTVTNVTPAADDSPLLQKQSRLIDLTSEGTSLRQAASTLLRQALRERHPEQEIDPDVAKIATPDPAENGLYHFETLTHALIRQSYAKTMARYLEGESFLTLTTHVQTAVHLAVDMDDINALLNDHSPFLFVAYQQQQLDYWNENAGTQPRWQMLADSFRAALSVHQVSGWNADECTLTRLIAASADKALRPVTNDGMKDIQARLIDLDLVEGANRQHLSIAGAIVLTATLGARQLIAMYTISAGYESFASMAELGDSLPARIDVNLDGRTLEWRLIEPDGDVFDAVTWALVASQLDAIAMLDPGRQPLESASSVLPQRNSLGLQDSDRLDRLDQSIPPWLRTASLNDLQAYRGYVHQLALLRDDHAQAFRDDDIPLIEAYAQQQMREAIIADVNAIGAADLPLDALRITVTASFEASGLVLPNPFDQSVETLGEFALQNTAPYLATLAFADDRAVPAWLTVDYLTKMAEQVNIGERYPKLIKQTLFDDPQRAAQQKTRYTAQLPVLLPLLALEAKLRGHARIDQRGYDDVCQLMNSIREQQALAEQPVTIRPLAFVPRNRLSKSADVIDNMFIISPREGEGPCLLYRPALDEPLLQFESPQNLLYALYQPGAVRDSVMAWFASEAVGFEYAQYVFTSEIPSPWVIPQLTFEPLIHLDLAGPIDLANEPMSGDVLATLYDANRQAMLALADRESVSNTERRWRLLADSGWALFDVASNFFTGAAGTAVWVWQSIGEIQKAIDAKRQGDTLIEWKSTGDVLLALSILLSQHIAARRNHVTLRSFKEVRQQTLESETIEQSSVDVPMTTPAKSVPRVKYDTVIISGDVPAEHVTSLESGTPYRSATGARFITLIDSFKIDTPEAPETLETSAVTHLSTIDGKSCAKVGDRWFEVDAAADPLRIVDSSDAARKGPAVRYDEASGSWQWDLKLRLLGGAPTGRIALLRRQREQQKNAAMAQLQPFLEGETRQQEGVVEALRSLTLKAAADTEDVFEAKTKSYLEKSMALGNGYTQALEQLQIWNESGGHGVFFESQLIRMTVEQHKCLSAWLRVKLRLYRQTVQKLMTDKPAQSTLTRTEQLAITAQANTLSEELVATLQTLENSLQALARQGGKAEKIGRDLKLLLPAFSRLNLQANEIGMSYEKSLRPLLEAELIAPRSAIYAITASAADVSHDMIAMRSVPVNAAGKSDRVEQLIRADDLFTNIEQIITELPETFPDKFDSSVLDHITQLIAQFHAIARKRMAEELPAAEEIVEPSAPRPGPSRPAVKGKISKSRPRASSAQKKPATAQDSADDDIPLVKLPPAKTPTPVTLVEENEVVAAAIGLNVDSDDFNTQTRNDAKRPGRIPADIRDIFDQQAARLDKAADDVAQILSRQRTRGEDPMPVSSLPAELRERAIETRAEGITTYASMLKQRKPRATYLLWLAKNDRVVIVKNKGGRIRTKQRKDYFQEYRILDKANADKPLWVAHFHYDSLADPDAQFTAAHLKFADDYLKTLDSKTRQTMENFDGFDNALRRIVDPQVRDLFLQPQPAEIAAD